MDYKKNTNQLGVMSHRNAVSIENFSIALPKKCERIATAVYLVTNFLPDTEPMKFRLRTLSIEFVRDASLLKSASHIVETNVLDALRSNISETLSLLELSLVAGLVSEMNFTVLKREYISLRDVIEVKKVSRESHTDNILGETFFGSSFHPEEKKSSPTPATISVSHMPKADTKIAASRSHFYTQEQSNSIGHNEVKMSDRKIGEVKRADLKNSVLHLNIQDTAGKVRATTNVLKETRRARILKLIKDNREVTIKDIATHFADLSEKTIQRELSVLVDGNVLKKTGERRWSRYALV